MVVNTILIVLAIATSGSIYYFTGSYNYWWTIFIFIIAIPILYIIWFLIYLIPIWIVSLFLPKKEEVKKPNKVCYWFVRQTCYVVPHLFRAYFKTSGEFPKERCMIVSNHTSNFDPMPIMWFAKNHPITCVTKPENMNLPIAGPYIWHCGFIPIDRENDFNAVKSIIKAANNIKKDVASVYICPEGTRNHHPENGMLDWHAGSFKIAFKAQCPIVVVAQTNAHKIAKQFWYRHTPYYIDVVEVIPYEKYKDWNTQSLANYCKEIIAKKLEERS